MYTILFYLFCTSFSSKKEQISKLIYTFWEQNIKDLEYFQSVKNYTIDFVLNPDLKLIKIVEINNPPPVAGTALFNWDSEKDLIIYGPFTFRILEKPLDNPKDLIHPPLKHYINLKRGLLANELSHVKISCNNCGKHPISETWYNCEDCADFDLCDTCYNSSTHNSDHVFQKFTTSTPESKPACNIM